MLLIQLKKKQTVILNRLPGDRWSSIHLWQFWNYGTVKYSALRKLLRKCAIILLSCLISGKGGLAGKVIRQISALSIPMIHGPFQRITYYISVAGHRLKEQPFVQK